MKTILVTGHDTEIGKTWVTRGIVRELASRDESVQVVKAVETGVVACGGRPDVEVIIEGLNPELVTGHTLYSFKAPLAPVSAGMRERVRLKFTDIVKGIKSLPKADWRIIETAGGVAVPLSQAGKDSRDLAKSLKVDYVVMVLENRLGTINQGRLMDAYMSEIEQKGFWFNSTSPTDIDVSESNYWELFSTKTPIWAMQDYGKAEPRFCNTPFWKKANEQAIG